MAAAQEELNRLFATPGADLPADVQSELQIILRLHEIDPQELFYKWESYSMKMGAEETKLDLKTARDFRRDLQELLEAESRNKAHARASDKRNVAATPRTGANGDVFGMYGHPFEVLECMLNKRLIG
jgi:DNA polymerase alpha subunit B